MLFGLSVGQMFLADAVPGILLGIAMLITTYLIASRNKFTRQRWQGVLYYRELQLILYIPQIAVWLPRLLLQ